MEIVRELLPGCLLLRGNVFEDARGRFVKTFHADAFAGLGLSFELREEFHSVSRRGVLRGMHFQVPPHHHAKLVHCSRGAVLDVVVDLRRGPGYGRFASVELKEGDGSIVFIPAGLAHGFLATEDFAEMHYKTGSVHAPDSDRGIGWNGFGFDWGVTAPLVSPRDAAHPALADFDSPFVGEDAS